MTLGHIPNIGVRGAKRRAAGGVVWTVVTIAALIAMIVTGARPGFRALLAIPVFLAAIGFLQAREKT